MIPASLFAGLFIHFALISIMAIGGFMATLPGMYSYLVDTAALLTPEQFAKTVAFGQSLPGPNMLIAGVLGWAACGPLGALARTQDKLSCPRLQVRHGTRRHRPALCNRLSAPQRRSDQLEVRLLGSRRDTDRVAHKVSAHPSDRRGRRVGCIRRLCLTCGKLYGKCETT